jgi:hypothetical protein
VSKKALTANLVRNSEQLSFASLIRRLPAHDRDLVRRYGDQ